MDDERAQFLLLLLDVCAGAGLARLVVEVVLEDGSRIRGFPIPPTPAPEDEELAEAGELRFGSRRIRLADVVRFAVLWT